MSEKDRDPNEIIEACRVLTGLGLVEGFGHVSMRLADSTVLITPRKALGLVEIEDLVHCTLDGEVLNDGRPPLETSMHLAVFRRRPDVGAICRTHSRYVNVLGIANRTIEVVHGFGAELRGPISVHSSPFLVTSPDRGDRVAEALGADHALVLRGNGALVVGDSPGEACVKAIFLEESAELQFLAAQIGQPTPFSPEAVQERLKSDLPNEPIRAWEFYRAYWGLNPERD